MNSNVSHKLHPCQFLWYEVGGGGGGGLYVKRGGGGGSKMIIVLWKVVRIRVCVFMGGGVW